MITIALDANKRGPNGRSLEQERKSEGFRHFLDIWFLYLFKAEYKLYLRTNYLVNNFIT